ncbi:RHS repeat domain-containing protein [Rhizohabitans arisaemae]|uniref:RHS repeat domain-containing protein n=1 Tax=Rhizohabitans arisaemae TaxID=2720610 RepID=UPI0024B14D7F|nr:RHS repeat-associated core domain-containing protein [Rhizohabitans arisaemae]
MRPIAAVVVTSLVAGLLPALPASAAPDAFTLPKIQKEHSIPGRVVTPDAPTAAAESDRLRWKGAPAATFAQPRTSAGTVVETGRRGGDGPVFALRPTGKGPLTVDLDTGAWAGARGGDWASRLTLVSLPECALTTPDAPHCRTGTPLKTTRSAGTLSTRVADATVIGVQAGPSGAAGTYTATSLSPTGSWSAGGNSGAFTYSYPIQAPQVPGSLEPVVTLGYNSAVVDGRTASSNNQPSWIGEGWDYHPGFVERSYENCPGSGEMCWKSDNATVSLGGPSVALVRDDATGGWRMADDDGSRVQQVDGAWVITKPNGTQYWFGRDRLPGWASGKPQTQSVLSVPIKGKGVLPWRWQLDYVVDPHGNVMTFYYDRERNSYAGSGYDRAGVLRRIEYGLREAYGTPSAAIDFKTEERCLTGCGTFDAANAGNWPDVPFDLNCSATPCKQTGPSFWTRKRLTGITTYLGGRQVDSWTLSHDFPDTGDSTSRALWLTQIQRAGTARPTTFHGTRMENRVDGIEGLAPLVKYRVIRIASATGADTLVTYSAKECVAGQTPDPAAGGKLCYPVYWTPPGESTPRKDWFHKYAVRMVVEDDKVAGSGSESIETRYDYLQPGWAKDESEFTKAEHRTHSVFRGFARVTVKTGATRRTQAQTLYLRGLGGTVTDSEGRSFTDDPALAGSALETLTYTGEDGALAAATVSEPWLSPVTATRARAGTTPLTARISTVDVVRTRTLQNGTWRRTVSDREFDDLGQVTSLSDEGDTAVTGDETCVTTTYTARDTANWLVGYVAGNRTEAGTCAARGAVLAETRTRYDGQPYKAAPKPGAAFATHVDTLDHGDVFVTATTGYDVYGRTVSSADELGRTVTTAYTPATGVPASVTVTDAKGFATTTTLEPVRGLPVAVTDPNGRTTHSAHDALGRLAKVWRPGRATVDPPSMTFDYAVTGTKPTVVTTRTLRENGSYATTLTFLDGLLRERQTQRESADGTGRVITDTHLDSHGRPWKVNAPYWNSAAIAPELWGTADNLIPAQTVNEYDGRGRITGESLLSLNALKWRTATGYDGDNVSVIPPDGASASTRIKDAQGRTVELRQYKNRSLDGPYDSTWYTHDAMGRRTKVVDPAGNTWTWAYDLRGRKVHASDPDTGTSTYRYDAAGQMVASTDARGVELAIDYDPLGRKSALKHNAVVLSTWAYDTAPGGKGLPAGSTRFDGGRAYSTAVLGYDTGGRPTGTSVTIPAAEGAPARTYTVRQTYTARVGLPRTTTYEAVADLPAENVVAGYNERDQHVSTTAGESVYLGGVAYSPFGEKLQTVYGDYGLRAAQTFAFDVPTRRLTQVINTRDRNDSTWVDDLTYTYNPAGDLTSVVNARDDGRVTDTQCYAYDHRRRLTSARATGGDCTAGTGGPAPYQIAYTYDVAGNRTSETSGGSTRTYTYAGGHTVRTAGTDTFEYDVAGNTKRRVTALGDQALTWNAEGKLATSVIGGRTTSFLYGVDGERLLRREPDGTTTLYLGAQELTLSGGVVTARRTYLDGVVRHSATRVEYLLKDHHGTAELSLDAGTLAAVRRSTTPFGTVRGPAPATWSSQKGFVGGTIDASTGLTHIGARAYDAANGRFISADPIMDLTDPQQINGYAYASNNPTTWSDPTGLRVCDGRECADYGIRPDGRPLPQPPVRSDDDIPPPPKGAWKPPPWGRPGCENSRCFKDVADPVHSKAQSEPISPIMQELIARQACPNWWAWCRWSGQYFTERHKRMQALHAGEGGIELCPKEVTACAGVPNPGNTMLIRLYMTHSSDRDGWQKAAETVAILGSTPIPMSRTPRGRNQQMPRGLASLGQEGLRMGSGLIAHGIVDGNDKKMPSSYYFPSLLYTQAKDMGGSLANLGSPIAGGFFNIAVAKFESMMNG